MDDLRRELLQRTLTWVRQESAFYREHLGQEPLSLEQIPFLTKAQACAHQAEIRCGPPPQELGTFTTGTTRQSGTPILRIEHVAAEFEAREDYRAALLAQSGSAKSERLVLDVVSPLHGFPRSTRPTPRVIWSPYVAAIELIRDALATPVGEKSIRVMQVSLGALKEATAYLERHPMGPLPLEEIYTYGNHLTPYWRQRIESAWGARVWDRYGLSEVSTVATECGECGFYHFGLPPVITEVIHPDHGAPLVEGVGELVLTTLYPFVQRQPFVRYRTGDLVEIGQCTSSMLLAVRPLGRLRDTSFEGPYPSRVESLLDGKAGVSHHVTDLERLAPGTIGAVGQPKFRLEVSSSGPRRLVVGVDDEPNSQRVRELENEITEAFGSALGVEWVEPSRHGSVTWLQKHAI